VWEYLFLAYIWVRFSVRLYPNGRYYTEGYTNSLHLYFPTVYVVIAAGEFDLVYVTPERFFGLGEGAMSPFPVERTTARAA